MVKHKNRFWANGANKIYELWKFYFFIVPPFFPCRNYDPPPQSGPGSLLKPVSL